jgi:hypothetical protein
LYQAQCTDNPPPIFTPPTPRGAGRAGNNRIRYAAILRAKRGEVVGARHGVVGGAVGKALAFAVVALRERGGGGGSLFWGLEAALEDRQMGVWG